MVEFVAYIRRFDTGKSTILVGAFEASITPGLLRNVMEHFCVGDLVCVELRDNVVKSVVRRQSIAGVKNGMVSSVQNVHRHK